MDTSVDEQDDADVDEPDSGTFEHICEGFLCHPLLFPSMVERPRANALIWFWFDLFCVVRRWCRWLGQAESAWQRAKQAGAVLDHSAGACLLELEWRDGGGRTNSGLSLFDAWCGQVKARALKRRRAARGPAADDIHRSSSAAAIEASPASSASAAESTSLPISSAPASSSSAWGAWGGSNEAESDGDRMGRDGTGREDSFSVHPFCCLRFYFSFLRDCASPNWWRTCTYMYACFLSESNPKVREGQAETKTIFFLRKKEDAVVDELQWGSGVLSSGALGCKR
jgi:hypothetical protein